MFRYFFQVKWSSIQFFIFLFFFHFLSSFFNISKIFLPSRQNRYILRDFYIFYDLKACVVFLSFSEIWFQTRKHAKFYSGCQKKFLTKLLDPNSEISLSRIQKQSLLNAVSEQYNHSSAKVIIKCLAFPSYFQTRADISTSNQNVRAYIRLAK